MTATVVKLRNTVDATNVKKRSVERETMTREELTNILGENASKEAIDQIMAINGNDVEKAKGKANDYKTQLTSLTQQLEESKKTIENLEKAQGDVSALQAEIEKYKAADAKREEEAQKAQLEAILSQTADEALKDKKFVNDVTKNYYHGELMKALADKANAGKSATDLFAAMTKDVEGIFANPQHEKLQIPSIDNQISDKEPTSIAEAMRQKFAMKG